MESFITRFCYAIFSAIHTMTALDALILQAFRIIAHFNQIYVQGVSTSQSVLRSARMRKRTTVLFEVKSKMVEEQVATAEKIFSAADRYL